MRPDSEGCVQYEPWLRCELRYLRSIAQAFRDWIVYAWTADGGFSLHSQIHLAIASNSKLIEQRWDLRHYSPLDMYRLQN
jgi:hypothetical protein